MHGSELLEAVTRTDPISGQFRLDATSSSYGPRLVKSYKERYRTYVQYAIELDTFLHRAAPRYMSAFGT